MVHSDINVLLVLGEMAVPKWMGRSTSEITQEDVALAYNRLLADISKCLYLQRSLDTARTYKEVHIDWWAGQRVNIPRLLELMGEWKEEVEKGSRLILKLFRKKNEVGLVDMSDERIKNYASGTMTPNAKSFENIGYRFLEAVKNLEDVGILKGKKESGFGALLSNFLSYFTDRNTKYAALQNLFESINNPNLMGALKSAHFIIEGLIEEIDELTEKCKAQAIEYETKRKKDLLEYYEIKQLEHKTRAMTLERSSAEDGIKATTIFFNTEREELQDLVATEPDMSEDCRKRMARKAAVRNCKSFLTEGLHYSNDEAVKLINMIQKLYS